jgi:hypothetical protein
VLWVRPCLKNCLEWGIKGEESFASAFGILKFPNKESKCYLDQRWRLLCTLPELKAAL